jgi:hypothetical protein
MYPKRVTRHDAVSGYTGVVVAFVPLQDRSDRRRVERRRKGWKEKTIEATAAFDRGSDGGFASNAGDPTA